MHEFVVSLTFPTPCFFKTSKKAHLVRLLNNRPFFHFCLFQDKKKKVTTKNIDLTIEGKTHGFVSTELTNYHELEVRFACLVCFGGKF